MNNANHDNKRISISCYHTRNRDGEQFVPEHTLSYQITGSLILNDGSKEFQSQTDSFRLIRRNQLLKFVKQPPEEGEFRSLSLYLDQQTLKSFSLEYGIVAEQKHTDVPVVGIKTTPLLTSYTQSLLAYQQTNGFDNRQFIDIKLKEGILLLLQANPELKNILFDFSDPFKIDLEAFMNRNFHFNVKLERFAYLTGRSLATFKRDFEKELGRTPGQWIRTKRLQHAYYLIKEKGKKASDIYLDLGFEDLSHFSFIFKKEFGEAPSKIG